MKILELDELGPGTVETADYVVFGGTFDPIHEGHVSVVRRLTPVFSTIIVAATAANPWKPEKPTPLELRATMIEMVLRAEKFSLAPTAEGPGIFITRETYCYSEELVDHLRAARSGRLFWAVGADSSSSVKDWRNWGSKGVTTVVLPIEIDAHAVLVRRGEAKPHPAIQELIRTEKLYV